MDYSHTTPQSLKKKQKTKLLSVYPHNILNRLELIVGRDLQQSSSPTAMVILFFSQVHDTLNCFS